MKHSACVLLDTNIRSFWFGHTLSNALYASDRLYLKTYGRKVDLFDYTE